MHNTLSLDRSRYKTAEKPNKCNRCNGSLHFVVYYSSNTGHVYCSSTCFTKGEEPPKEQLNLALEEDACTCRTCAEP